MKHNLEFLGIVQLGPEPSYVLFKDWLDRGLNAEMDFLKNYLELRQDSSRLLDGSVQALIFGLNYNQGDTLNTVLKRHSQIAQYARLRDYHKSLRQRGEAITAELKALYPGLGARVVVDSAPVLERALADRTTRGFIGKNTCFIHPDKGSLMLLSEIIIDREIFAVDQKTSVDKTKRSADGGCGSCKRCQVYCPTGALDEAFKLDARKCLAYWTIEHRGTIPEEFWPHVKTYIFGCDLCQLACPYNRGAALTPEETVLSAECDPYDIACMSQEDYVRIFGGTPATRAKRSGLRRNALIALAELQDERLEAAIACVMPEDEPVLHHTVAQIRAR